MITINYPTTNTEFFFELQGVPITNVKSPLMKADAPVVYTSSLDTMVQGHENIGGENSVDHQKVDAVLSVSLMRFESTRPASGNPHAVTYYYQGQPRTSELGFYEDGASYSLNVGTANMLVWAFRTIGDVYHLYKMTYNSSTSYVEWWDFYVQHVPLTATTARFIHGGTFAYLSNDLSGFSSLDSGSLDSMPTAHGARTYQYNFGTYEAPYPVYSRVGTKTLPPVRHMIDRASGAAFGLSVTKCPIQDYDYGTLALEATESSRINKVNMLAFIADLRSPKSLVPKLKNLRNIPRDPALLRELKNASDDYLTLHYGVLPTVDDIETIVGAARKNGQYYDRNGLVLYTAGRTTSSSMLGTEWEVIQHLKLATAADELVFESITRGFDNLGLFPSYENVWDLIPFSFVVDWFINVGDFLEDYDNLLRLDRLNVQFVTMSKKTTASLPLNDPETGLHGTMSLVQYHRWVTRQCPVPKLTFSKTSQTTNHWLESSALILSRTHH